MSDHPNVTTVNRMTQAIFEHDQVALGQLFTDDMVFHLRGPYERAGDHAGVAGLLEVRGSIFEATGGDIKLEQQFCVGPTAGRRSGSTPPWGATARPSNPTTLSCTASRTAASPRCGWILTTFPEPPASVFRSRTGSGSRAISPAPAGGWSASGSSWTTRTLTASSRATCITPTVCAGSSTRVTSRAPESSSRGRKVAERFRDREVRTLAQLGEGRCVIYLGDIAEGLSLLDQAMVSVEAREVSPVVAGDAYCIVIDACNELFDVRARRATAELTGPRPRPVRDSGT